MRRGAYFGAALVGLLVVAAISVAAGSGRRPAEVVNVSSRQVSTGEAMDILRKFPDLVPDYLVSKKNDAEYMARLFGFVEVTAAPLTRIFPLVRFYRGHDFARPPNPYMMATAGDKGYGVYKFNQLLIDNGLEVTDKNIVELAEAFVVLAIGNMERSFPGITFSDGRKVAEVRGGITFDARLKVSYAGRVEEWWFDAKYGQFALVSRGNANGLIKQYLIKIVDPVQKQGWLRNVPNIDVDSGASLEREVRGSDTIPHYYASVEWNDSATGRQVRFSLTGFLPNARNVYVRVKDSLWAGIRHFRRVSIDGQGAGTDTWTPRVESTGICVASAGYADTLDTFPFPTYRDTSFVELTPEKVRVTAFADSGQWLRVHFCQQFFRNHNLGPGHDTVFVRFADTAMLRSWRTQVCTWNLGVPPDADHIHQVLVNDAVNWYHAPAGTATYDGSNRRIALGYDPLHIDTSYMYTDEESAVQSFLAHEFYHGVQWGLSQDKWLDSTWNWFTEGQARFLQSVQSQSEEFLSARRLYPRDANRYLTQHLNTSLVTLSGDTVMKANGYPYCLFWRFMFEHFLGDSSFPQPKKALQLVSDCYAVNVGTSNSIGRGKAAIDSAISTYVPGYIPPPGWSNFGQVLDQFAVACYLNDPAFNKWNPNPPGVYSRPHLTPGTDTAFRLGPNETDTIGFTDSIPHSFGIDLMQVALDTIVDTVLVSFVRDTGTGRTLSARLVNVYPTGLAVRYRVEPPIESVPDSSTTWQQYKLPTAGKERICLVVTRHDTLDNSGCVDTARFWVKRAVAVTKLLPATDTLMSGTPFTQRAVVVNRGWMKESLYVRFRIDADTGTVWSDSQLVTFSPGDTDTVVFNPWTAKEGAYNTCCWVYLKSDSTRSDDTLHGFLEVLPERDDFWHLDFDDGSWNRDMAQPCADSGMQSGGGGRIRHQWVCCWHENIGDTTWPYWYGHSSGYACLSWQESTASTWDSMISPRINLAGCHSCSLFQSTYYTLDGRGTKQVLVSANDGLTWTVVWDGAWNGGQPPDTINISQYADGSRDVRIAWVYYGPVQKDSAWCVDDVEIRGAPARSCDVAVNGIAYPCGAITYGTPIVPRAYVVNHGVQSESLLVHMNIDGNTAQTHAWLAPHADTLVEFPSPSLAPGNHTMTCYVTLPLDTFPANDTATMSFSVVADTWMPKFPVYNGQGMRSGAAIVAVDSEKLFCVPGNGSPTNGRAFAKYLVAEDLWKARHTTPLKFVPGSAMAYSGAGDTVYAIRGGTHNAFYGYSISQDRWFSLPGTLDTLGRGAGLACLGRDSVFALRGSGKKFYCYDVAGHTWSRRHDTPDKIGKGGRLVSLGGYLYAFRGGGYDEFYKYIPGVDSWCTLAASTPMPVKTGAAMACDTVYNLIYAFFGGNEHDYDSAIYAYDGYQWLPRHRTPAATRSGGCITYANHSVYGGVGIGGDHRFWRYSPPSGGSFLEAEDPPGWTGPGEASLPTKDYVGGDRLDPGEQLTYDPSDKQTPQYSPDGLWIAYTACDTEGVVAGLYRIPAAGGPPDPLGSDGVTYEDPRWSHSHSWLVAAADDGIYKVASGTPPVRLAAGIVAGPCVTPDDSWVLYEAFDNTEHLHQVRRVRPDGTGDTCLTPETDEYLEPQPISDSQFVCARLKNEVYQLEKITGGRETWLTSDYAENTGIDVSPTGQWLAYQKLDESGFWQIYKMRVDGSEETRITDGTCNCETPVFSPDGSYIAYTKWPDGYEYSQVCYKDTNSATAEVALNSPDAMRENPCWSPDCQYIIYELTTESGTPAFAPGRKKQLKQIGRARTHIKHHGDGVEGLSIIPRTFALYQNRPNPFGRATTIRYALPVSSLTELSIFDVAGRSVTRLVQSEQKPGYYSIAWKGTDMRGRSVAAGTYFYVLKSNGKIAQKRMLLVR